MEMKPALNTKLGSAKTYLLTLTMESDPSFFFYSEICAATYAKIKKEQNLFIDYPQLPHHLDSLLDFCISSYEGLNSSGSRSSFLCIAKSLSTDSSDLVLQFCENNEFKQIQLL